MTSQNPLRVLIVHNRYQHAGGEDSVVASETELLRNRGHHVRLYMRDNTEVETMGNLSLFRQTLWSRRTIHDMDREFADFQPQVVHVHNSFPLISGSVYWACSKHKVPVVQTLHNFRVLCAQAMLLRDGKVCEDCLGKLPWRGVVHKCYRGSTTQSGALVAMISGHRMAGTYRNKITRYIALNEFCRLKFMEGGLPGKRIVVKPNFVDLPPLPSNHTAHNGFLFVGRLSPEKGVGTLVNACRRIPEAEVEVIGTGPQSDALAGVENIRAAGFQEPHAVIAAMKRAGCLIMPSLWYENFPRTLVEAYACGLPVIASRIGALAELVHDGKTGLLFEPGSAWDLVDKMRWALEHPEAMRRMGETARLEYEARYTPEINYRQLMVIYRDAIDEAKSAG